MIVMGIDPATQWHRVGWATFYNGVLAVAEVGRPQVVPSLDVLVIEIPRSYPNDNETNLNDLIDMGIVAGICIEQSKAVRVIRAFPRDWKGQTPKGIHNRRVVEALTADERTRVSTNHNAIDAVGLGLWFLQRIRR